MKKFIIMVSTLIIIVTVFLFLFFNTEEKFINEKVYSIKTNYSYLSDGKVLIPIKLYSNNKNSLLKYANESNATLHDLNEENVVSIDVVESRISSVTYLEDENLYEYILKTEINITSLVIDDCYLSLKFSNNVFTFEIGRVEVEEKGQDFNNINITNLYGLSSEDDISLHGLVITFNNRSDTRMKISNIKIGSNYELLLNKNNVITPSDSLKIEEYEYVSNESSDNLIIEGNSSTTYLIPIKYTDDYFLYNCYLLIEIDGEKYYISNFDYINSNDLNRLIRYIEGGVIYEF